MNEEQSKRTADAAEAIVSAAEALDEAREASNDRRFDSEQERDRQAATQQLGSRVESAAKRIDEAVRKGAVAAAVAGRAGGFDRYREAAAAAREGRALGRTISDQDGTPARRARAEEALERLAQALQTASELVFVE
jgi:hypothetical protein